jgi:hypothetical protein
MGRVLILDRKFLVFRVSVELCYSAVFMVDHQSYTMSNAMAITVTHQHQLLLITIHRSSIMQTKEMQP